MSRNRIWEEAARMADGSAWAIAAGCLLSLALAGAAFCAGRADAAWGAACAMAAIRAVTLATAGGLMWDLWRRRESEA